MKGQPDAGWSDEELVADIKHWAEEWAKCGLDMDSANKINEERLVPDSRLLTARGSSALGKLIPLLEDENRGVRLAAAAFAFNVAPDACRPVLRKLMKKCDVIGLWAWAAWAEREPDTAPPPQVLLQPTA